MTTLDIVGLIMAALLLGALALIYIRARRDTSLSFKKEEEIKKENPYVKCEDCACILDKESAAKVTHYGLSNFAVWNKYYCHEHKKPYNQQCLTKYYRTEWIEVDEYGKPVKK